MGNENYFRGVYIYIYCHKNIETKSSNFVTCGQVLTVKESMVDTCLPVSQALP